VEFNLHAVVYEKCSLSLSLSLSLSAAAAGNTCEQHYLIAFATPSSALLSWYTQKEMTFAVRCPRKGKYMTRYTDEIERERERDL
jgi:hypothetical protein